MHICSREEAREDVLSFIRFLMYYMGVQELDEKLSGVFGKMVSMLE